ncbi:MAG: LicD family protein [Treponemataceae bacterium]|nr:LicD family protein [Treponemataceae bacterium]
MENLDVIHNVLLDMLKDLDAFCRANGIRYSLAYGTALGAARHGGFIPWDDDLDIMMTRENYDRFLSLFKDTETYTLQREQADYPLYFSKLRKNNTTFIENIKYRKRWAHIHQGIYIDIFPADKVARNAFPRFVQTFLSNILISQSLFLRGYQTKNIAKWIFMLASFLLVPFRTQMFRFVKKFNKKQDCELYCCFSGDTRKVFIRKNQLENLRVSHFNGGGYLCMDDLDSYLEAAYGDWKTLPDENERAAKIHARIFAINKDYKEFLK